MLVLSRYIGEQIVIGNGAIEITVLYVRGNRVALGFNAPIDMPLDRKEIHVKKMASLQKETP